MKKETIVEKTAEKTVEEVTLEQIEPEEIEIGKDWIGLEKYPFKVLVMVTVLADRKRAFRGKITDLCEELSIQKSSANVKRIKETLAWLETEGYIKIIADQSTYTITLAKSAEKNSDIIKIKRKWYKLIREAESEASWEAVLKVFLYVIGNEKMREDPITYREMGLLLNCGATTVKRAVKTVTNINFDGFKIMKKVITEKVGDDFVTFGTIYYTGFCWGNK